MAVFANAKIGSIIKATGLCKKCCKIVDVAFFPPPPNGMAKAKKKFDEDFKKMILDLNQSGQSVEELAAQYGIATQTIYRWKKLYTKNEATGMTKAEILAMKKEMARMQEENTILKKALTIFAQK